MSADTTHFRSVSLGPRGLTKRYTGLGYYLGCRMSYCMRTRGHLPSGRVRLRAGSNAFCFFGTSVLDGRISCSASGGFPTGLIAVDKGHTFRIVNVGGGNVGPSDLLRRREGTRPGGPVSLLRRRDMAHFSHDHGGDGRKGGTGQGGGGGGKAPGGGQPRRRMRKAGHPRRPRQRGRNHPRPTRGKGEKSQRGEPEGGGGGQGEKRGRKQGGRGEHPREERRQPRGRRHPRNRRHRHPTEPRPEPRECPGRTGPRGGRGPSRR